jgi:hypothetical protein
MIEAGLVSLVRPWAKPGVGSGVESFPQPGAAPFRMLDRIGPVLPAETLASGKISLRSAVMADAEQSIPDIYREAAEEVRQLARRARLTDIRGDLLELSARFERLAAYADAAIRLGAPGYPRGERLPFADNSSDGAPAADRPLSSGSGPHTAFTSQDRRLPNPVIEPVENAPKAVLVRVRSRDDVL